MDDKADSGVVSGYRQADARGLVGQRAGAHEVYCLAAGINQSVERWNHWARCSRRPDAENYVEGEIKFAFVYEARRRLQPAEDAGGDTTGQLPLKFATAERRPVTELERKVWDKPADRIGGKFYVVVRWNQQLVLVEDVHLMDEGEKLVPSLITVWPYGSKGAVEACPGMFGQSLLKSTVEPVCFFGVGELESLALPYGSAVRRDDFPIGVIEGSTDVVGNIASDQARLVYDGFVLFGEESTLSGFGIRFNDQSERSRFAEEFVKLSDVFRGPTNLEKCAVCHG